MACIDTEAEADKGMQIHSGILMNLESTKSIKGGIAFMEINHCMVVH